MSLPSTSSSSSSTSFIKGSLIVGNAGVGVSRFSSTDGETNLLPDFSVCQPPLRMRHTIVGPQALVLMSSSSSLTKDGTSKISATVGTENDSKPSTAAMRRLERDASDSLTFSDASGKHVFLGSREKLESQYVVMIEEPETTLDSDESSTVFRILPVSSWYTFTRAPSDKDRGAQLSVAEQQELFEMTQAYNSRPPTSASLAFQRFRASEAVGGGAGSRAMATEGGVAGDDGVEVGAEDVDGGADDNYRTSMANSLRASKSSRRNPEDRGFDVRGGDLDAAYDELDGVGAGDVTEDAARPHGGYNQDEAAEVDAGRTFDVLGGEGAGAEEGVELGGVDYFADDDGEAGATWGVGDDALGEVGADGGNNDDNAEDGAAILNSAQAGADAEDGEEEGLGIDLDADDIDADKLTAEAARVQRGGGIVDEQADQPVAGAKRKADALGSDAELRAAKRGRLDEATLRAELISFLKSQGGRATSDVIARNFGKLFASDKDLKRRFFALINEVTRRETRASDAKLFFVLNREK